MKKDALYFLAYGMDYLSQHRIKVSELTIDKKSFDELAKVKKPDPDESIYLPLFPSNVTVRRGK